MTDAREILIPRFIYIREINSKAQTCSAILKYSNSKQAIRVYRGVSEFIQDLEAYKSKNEHLEFTNVKNLYGTMGVIRRGTREYLLLIEECTLIGQILKANIFRVDEILVISLQEENEEDMEYTDSVKDLVNDQSFYFSYNYNLTHSLQENIHKGLLVEESKQFSDEDCSEEYFPNYDKKFIFNKLLLSRLNNCSNEHLWPFIVPLIYGVVSINSTYLDENKVGIILISRKDCNRLGRRFTSRGIDDEGNVSNFVETEHILIHYEQDFCQVASYTQIRGSIPLFWTQKPTLKYAPTIGICTDDDKNKAAAEKHFSNNIEKYGDHVLINLVDKKGSQNKIGTAFTNLIKSLNNERLHYEWFDFHGECKNMQWENLKILINNIKEKIDEQKYFMASLDHTFDKIGKLTQSNCKITQTQIGVCRTNCMDCLDRTNVVQSVISRLIAHRQLWKMNILDEPKGDVFESFPKEFDALFRQAWTNNANVCSILYSGTPALKTDFTLTGKRSAKGAVVDGINSAKRYYINNFCDSYNQDILDSTVLSIDLNKDGVSDHQLEKEKDSTNGYTMKFIHLITVAGIAGFTLKSLFQ
ncbi:unnamed protein product [Moneuplotes crassus]|uniref:SAC domain-containing protein n=1 Tax=Euplotes crassus TaxID=5936 RepID=A0AAD1UBD4_EUPCR|nr:unnamed protein product [Moneuplotes crassus]